MMPGLCVAASDSVDAVTMVKNAAVYVKSHGVKKAVKDINDPAVPFVKGALYVFAYDTNGTMLAHPMNPALVGKNMVDVPDLDGTYFRKRIVAMAREHASGWVDYKYRNPKTKKLENKKTFVLKVGSLILCCGTYYK